jgi:predicted CXXCH cytochrome family protein
MRKETFMALFGVLLLRAEGALGQPGGTGEGAHVLWNEESCVKCHDATAAAEIRSRLTNPCSQMCATCHSFQERHHAVGVPISGHVQAPLVLTRKVTNTCVTCHDVTRPRFERSAWVSQSLFERAFRAPRENRTFYLVMRNDRGQLCRNCH